MAKTYAPSDGYQASRPLSARELMQRPDIPPTADVPPAAMSALSTPHLLSPPDLQGHLHSLAATVDRDVSESLIDTSVVQVRLPVLSAVAFTVEELAKVKGAPAGPASPVPGWTGMSFLPKASVPEPISKLRRRNGKQVIPVDCSTECNFYGYGGDARSEYVPSGYPWICIGKLLVYDDIRNNTVSSAGTGVLVGRNIVLTASHVMPWDAPNPAVQFVAGAYDGNGVTTDWVQMYRGVRNHAQGDDIAVLRLYNPLGDGIGYFGWQTYTDDWEDEPFWIQCGYPCDKNSNRPYREFGIAVKDDDSEGDGVELEHESDIACGMSGGPLWAFWGEAPLVTGTLSGHEPPDPWESSNVSAGGPLLANLISWARTNWQPKDKEKDKEKEPSQDKAPDGKHWKDESKMVDALNPMLPGRSVPAGTSGNLEPGHARPFIRPGERPDVGGSGVFGQH